MTTVSRARVHLRWMIRPDMEQVLAIEAASFDRPWGEQDFLRFLRHRDRIGFVAEGLEPGRREGPVVAYMLYQLGRGWLRLHALAVAPAWRRAGVGTQLVDKLLGKLRPAGRTRLLADVRETNLAAQLWLRACGLRCEGVLRDHYDSPDDTGEDAYRMEHRLPAAVWTGLDDPDLGGEG